MTLIPASAVRKHLTPSVGLVNLVGREDVLRREAVRLLIRLAVQRGTEDWNVVQVRGDGDPMAAALQPVLGGRRVVVVADVDFRSFSRLRAPDTLLISWDGAARSPDLEVDCRRMYGQRLRGWLRTRSRELGAEVDAADAEHLVEAFGNDAALLEQQLVKLSLLDHAEGRHVMELCREHREADLRTAVNAAAAGQPADAVDALNAAVVGGTPPAEAVAALRRRFFLMARLGAGLETGPLSDAEAARLASEKSRYDWEQLAGMVARLADLEWRLRSGSVGPEEAVAAVAGILVMLAK